jgi:hypothetical protein
MAEKGFFILGALIYLIFSIIVVKQTTTLSKNVHDKFNGVLVAFSFIHLAFSFLLVFFTIVLL